MDSTLIPEGRRSDLDMWLTAQWPMLSRLSAINWRWLMREIAAAGVTNRDGKPVNLRTAQNTWYRVNDRLKKNPPAQPLSLPREPTPRIGPDLTKVQSAPTPSPTTAAPIAGARQFGFVKPKED